MGMFMYGLQSLLVCTVDFADIVTNIRFIERIASPTASIPTTLASNTVPWLDYYHSVTIRPNMRCVTKI